MNPTRTEESFLLPTVFMVEQETPRGAWIGQSIHLTQAAADAACAPGERVTSFIVSDPEKTVRIVSERLRNRNARMGLNQVAA